MTTITVSVDSVNGTPVGAGALPQLAIGQPNKVILSLACAGDDIRLKGGTSVPPGTANAPASLYLSFPADTFTDPSKFSVTPPAGWNKAFLDTPHYLGWALSPKQDVTLPAGTSLAVTLDRVGVIARNDPGRFDANLNNVAPARNVAKSFKVITRTQGTDLTNIVDFGFDDDDGASHSRDADEVFISNDPAHPLVNKLIFHISNLTQAPLVSQPWGTNPPTFTLFFATAEANDPDAAGALTTPAMADKIDVAIAQTYQDRWERLARAAGDLTWRLRPKAAEVLGAGAGASVQFDITNIVSLLPEGMTWAYLTYSDVPGYTNGFLARQIQRRAPVPSITQFVAATPYTINSGDPVRLSWQTFSVRGLKLSYQIGGLRYVRQTAIGAAAGEIALNQTYAPLPLPVGTTDYILQILDASGAAIADTAQHLVRIEVTPRPAVINSFVATPNPGPTQGNPFQVTLTWDVAHATQVELRNDDIKLDITPVQPTWSGQITAPTTFFLHATGEDGKLVIGQVEVLDLFHYLPGKILRATQGWLNGMPCTEIAFEAGGAGQAISVFFPNNTINTTNWAIHWTVSGYDVSVALPNGTMVLTWNGPGNVGITPTSYVGPDGYCSVLNIVGQPLYPTLLSGQNA